MRLRITTDDGHAVVETEAEVAELRALFVECGFAGPIIDTLDDHCFDVADDVAARFFAARDEYRAALAALYTEAYGPRPEG